MSEHKIAGAARIGSLSTRDRRRLQASPPLAAVVQPVVSKLASLRDWQDNPSFPGWEPSPGSGMFRVMAGRLPEYALADGGWVYLWVTGTYQIGSDDPRLLFRLWTQKDPGDPKTYIGPDLPSQPGWGWANDVTGPGAFETSGRFRFELKVSSLGRNATPHQLFAEGSIQIGPTSDGPQGKLDRFDIWNTFPHDLDSAQTWMIESGWPADSNGTDAMHVDGGEMWFFGGRGGFECH